MEIGQQRDGFLSPRMRQRTIKWINERRQEQILLSRVGPQCPMDTIHIRELIQSYQEATGTCVYCD